MDDGHTDDPTAGYDIFNPDEGDDFGTSPQSDPWPGVGARRSPRSPAEGVRIIGAEEAAAAIESGQATPRSPDDAPRFGDVPQPPPGPRPPLRFPGADPAAVAKPPLAPMPSPSMESERSGLRGGAERDSYVEDAFWDDPDEGLGPAEAGRRGVVPGGAGAGSDPWGGPGGATASSYDEPPGASDATEAYGYGSRPPADPGGGGELAGSFREALERDRMAAPSMDVDFDDDRYGSPSTRSTAAEDAAADRFFGPMASDPGPGPGPGPERPAQSGGYGSGGGGDAGYGAMPHWTEPPSGEVPRILPDAEPPGSPDDDDLKAWSTLSSGPRWRDQEADWDESDFTGAEMLDDPEMRVGALRADPVDDDEEAFLP
ncbi:MAG: hypothetical protein M3179_02940, partial [Actinomycetota bacterium]|nr:hypothetical protein [Actinomycetota bacterium]